MTFRLKLNAPASAGVFLSIKGYEMNAHEAIRAMIKKRGRTLDSISTELGRSKNWLSATLYLADDSRTGTVAEIARACGFALVLIPRSAIPPGALVIDGRFNPCNRREHLIYSINNSVKYLTY